MLLTLAVGQSLTVLTGIQILTSSIGGLARPPLGVMASAPLLILWGIALTRTRVTFHGTTRSA